METRRRTRERLVGELGALRSFSYEAQAFPEVLDEPAVVEARSLLAEARAAVARVDERSDEESVRGAWQAVNRAREAIAEARTIVEWARAARVEARERAEEPGRRGRARPAPAEARGWGPARDADEPGLGGTPPLAPTLDRARRADPRRATPDALPRGNDELVLIVDDEAFIREIADETLRGHGYRVLTASHGSEALELYERHSREVRAVVTDLSMPVMDGPATVRALRERDPDIRVVVMSGRGDGATRASGLGVLGFLPKPFTPRMLVEVVQAALAPRPGH
jgi:CheY-like chemotaxis protein